MSKIEQDKFAKAAYRVLIIEKARHTRDVANALGLKYATFHARLVGRIPFRPGEISSLLKHVPDIRLADALLTGTDFRPVRRLPQSIESTPRTVLHNPSATSGKVAQAFRDLEVDLSDSSPSDWDLETMKGRIDAAQHVLDALRLVLPQPEARD